MHSGRLHGVRFQTNLRSSQWFRSRHTDAPVNVISAGCGTAIHSLVSTKGGRLGALLWPTTTTSAASEQRGYSYEETIVSTRSTEGHSFGADVKEVAAIVVTVLSRDGYARYVAMIDIVSLASIDHVVELVVDEKVLKVECVHDRSRLQAIRFVTTRRETPWYGSKVGASLWTKSVSAPSGAHISGLFGRQTNQHVTEVGVVIACPVEHSQDDKIGPEATTKPKPKLLC